MVEHPKDLEEALDIVWAALYHETVAWRRVFPKGTLGCTRVRVAEITGWSYSTVYRLVNILLEREQVVARWTHQHQSYWEGYFCPTVIDNVAQKEVHNG